MPPGFDLEANEARTQRLIDLIATGEAIAIIGAGVSIQAGYDSWPGLLTKLERAANTIRPGLEPHADTCDPRDYLSVAQRIRDHIVNAPDPAGKNRWHTEIGRIFARSDGTLLASLTPLHRDLVSLPFRAFCTTNYESVIEVALKDVFPQRGEPLSVALFNGNDRRMVSRAIRGIASVQSGAPYVIHLHGMYWAEGTVIMCADEYADAYGIPTLGLLGPSSAGGEPPAPGPAPSTPMPLFLLASALMTTRRIVFIGFSLDDVYLTEVLRRVSDVLWEWDTATHFAVMPVEAGKSSEQLQRAADLRAQLGIETVFYPVDRDNYAALESLISRIASDLRIRTSAAAAAEPTRAVASAGGGPLAEWAKRNNAAQLAKVEAR
jgi:hypothetical protein